MRIFFGRSILTVTVAGMVLLAACSTPQEKCINRVSKEMHTIDKLRQETAANISRGYAIDVSYVPYTTYGTCYYGNGRRYSCPQTYTRTVTKPRTIDVAQERSNLKELEQKLATLQEQSAPYIAQCKRQYPEDA